MATRLTLRPGQSGTKKLVARYGERLVRVRYLYDSLAGRRLKTVMVASTHRCSSISRMSFNHWLDVTSLHLVT